MIKYTIEIEYEYNVNFREIVTVTASSISALVHTVDMYFIGENGKSAVVLRIIKQEEI